MRIAICDDMKDYLDQTYSLIQKWPQQPHHLVIETFLDGDSLIESHRKVSFDVIFLDIIMPLMNGMEVAKEIRTLDKNVKIVFLTTSKEYAIDSYSVKANHYLLKPIDTLKLYACLNEYKEELEHEDYLYVKGVNALYKLAINDIEYIEAQGKKVLFALYNGDIIESNQPFYSYEKQLLEYDSFIKCHRSYIVNVYRIQSFNQKEIIMPSLKHIPISRSHSKDFEAIYFDLFFKKVGE